MHKKTKIVCTLGPSSDSVSELERMLEAGMNVARLNFSHGSYEHMTGIIRNLRAASKNTKKTVAILQDLQGPKIRLGQLPSESVKIEKGQKIILSTAHKTFQNGTPPIFPVQYEKLHEDVKSGDPILIDDGYIEVQVESKKGRHIFCTVKTPGILKSHKGINCPNSSLQAKTITRKDLQDLNFGLKQNIDYVALSFVKNANDLDELRAILKKKGKPHVKIIAKIERREAIKDLKTIVKASDGVMVARGDLGLEIPAEQVPIVQKEIVQMALTYGKPVIIATQILESMIKNPRATRAEISDAATAIFDHADAFMLSAESSVGKYPVKAVQTLAKVAHAVESELGKREHLVAHPMNWEESTLDLNAEDANCYNAAILAEEIGARAIVIFTRSGYSALHMMKHRPNTQVITLTNDQKTERQLQLVWGLNTILLSKKRLILDEENLAEIKALLKNKTWLKSGDQIVLIHLSKEKSVITTLRV